MTTTEAVTPGAAGSDGAPEVGEAAVENEVPGSRGVGRGLDRIDAAVLFGYLLAAVVLLWGVWSDLEHGYLTQSLGDQTMWEWFFSYVAHALRHGENPLFTTLLNQPQGVNIMANTAMLGVSVPLAPLTLLAGPTAPYVAALTLGMAGTAAAWYWTFSRHLVPHRGAAAVAGAFAGFAPAMISHGQAHPNFVACFVIPALVLTCLRLAAGQHVRRDGVILGLLVTLQVLLGEELLLICATGGFVVAVLWAWNHPEDIISMWRPFAKGVGIAAVVTLVLVCVPLWWQFVGPQSYKGISVPKGAPLDAFTAFPSQTLLGDPDANADISLNRLEENAFFGWPLLVLLTAIVVVWWRDLWVRTLGLASLITCSFALGATVKIGKTDTGVPSPWYFLQHVPLYDTMLNTRFTYAAIPMFAALLALGTEKAWRAAKQAPSRRRRDGIRAVWIGALGAALLPIVPIPFQVDYRPSPPAFVTAGIWRSYVDPGGSVVPVPLSDPNEVQSMHWQAATNMDWSQPGGCYVGPGPDGKGMYGTRKTVTDNLFASVRRGDPPPFLSDRIRGEFRNDLRLWNANVLVLVPGPNTQALRRVVDDLAGEPGQVVGGTVVWDVRPSHTPPRPSASVPPAAARPSRPVAPPRAPVTPRVGPPAPGGVP